MPTFDIIVPTHNNLTELQACLEGFSQQSLQSFRVIICVDGSIDGTVEFLSAARYTFEHQFVQHPDGWRHGRNATRNLALPFLDSEYLLLLDSDAVPSPHMLGKHLECLRRHDGVSLGIIAYSNRDTNLWAAYTSTRGRYKIADAAPVGYHLFNTGNAAFRTRYFLELGGQDPTMTHYGGGDSEFAVRLKERVDPVFINNKQALAFSEMNKDLDTALEQMVEFGRYNLRYLYDKHPSHRHLYGMKDMKRFNLFFRMISNKPSMALARFLILLPKNFSSAIIRYLVIASIFRGFIDPTTEIFVRE